LARSRSTRAPRNAISYEERSFGGDLRQILDPQALLIMHELSRDVRRFQNIQMQTAMSSSLLTSRLRRLERDGIISRRLYCDHPPRFEYLATPKGKDLDQVLLAANMWHSNWNDSSDVPFSTIDDAITKKRLPSPSSKSRYLNNYC
jgi:DNA-binding HxlR family transcriptional regulator